MLLKAYKPVYSAFRYYAAVGQSATADMTQMSLNGWTTFLLDVGTIKNDELHDLNQGALDTVRR